jgi:predicted AAA+ superfamily ATPase
VDKVFTGGATMIFKRPTYLAKLIELRDNGIPKVVTGVRRSGKTYLLFDIYRPYLLEQGVKADHIVSLDLSSIENIALRNPIELEKEVKKRLKGDGMNYVFIDEITLVDAVPNPALPKESQTEENQITFYEAVISLSSLKNVDLYITGSNSKLLSKDVATRFRDRAIEIHVNPLTFKEFYGGRGGDKHEALAEYLRFGGLPRTYLFSKDEDRAAYLNGLFKTTYLKDILERNKIERQDVLDDLIDELYSTSGHTSNVHRLTDTINSKLRAKMSYNTVKDYVGYLLDVYLFSEVKTYDVKGKAYFDSLNKYYSVDVGLRNAKLNYRERDRGFTTETIVYNALVVEGYSVDVGRVVFTETNKEGKRVDKASEIDFVLNLMDRKVYLQVFVDGREKEESEKKPLLKTGDAFKKIIVEDTSAPDGYDEDGIYHLSLLSLLLNPEQVASH